MLLLSTVIISFHFDSLYVLICKPVGAVLTCTVHYY